MKLTRLLAFSILMTVAVAAITANAKTTGDLVKQISEAPALKYLAKGVEKQYDVRCSSLALQSYADSDFVARIVCADKDAKNDEEASAVILTIEGTTIEDSPVILSNIKVDYAN